MVGSGCEAGCEINFELNDCIQDVRRAGDFGEFPFNPFCAGAASLLFLRNNPPAFFKELLEDCVCSEGGASIFKSDLFPFILGRAWCGWRSGNRSCSDEVREVVRCGDGNGLSRSTGGLVSVTGRNA